MRWLAFSTTLAGVVALVLFVAVRGASAQPNVRIVSLDCDSNPETVVLHNFGDQPQSLTGWELQSDPGQSFSLVGVGIPSADGVLDPGESVTIHSGSTAPPDDPSQGEYRWTMAFRFRNSDPTDYAALWDESSEVQRVNCGETPPTPTATPKPTATPEATPTPMPTPTPTPTPPPFGQLLNCPQAGKWSIAVYNGAGAAPADLVATTCEEVPIEALYWLDPQTQTWLRLFPGRPEISNLTTLANLQGVLALGSGSPSASAARPLAAQSQWTGQLVGCPQPGKWAISVWNGTPGRPADQAFATCPGVTVAAAYRIDPERQTWERYFADRLDISDLRTLGSREGVITLGSSDPRPTTLKVHFIDVGQGDAILAEIGDMAILVDGGPREANVADYLDGLGLADIDLMVVTHPHADHISGLVEVLQRYDVDEIWVNGDTTGTGIYGDFAVAVAAEQAAGALYREVTRGHDALLNGLYIAVLHPPELTGDLNEDSVVTKLTCGAVDILLTGDATMDSEANMLADSAVELDAEVLKVGHHGSNTSTSDAFLAAVTPDDAVISVGAGNTYGHPHQETLDRLAAHGVTVYRTDVDGIVVLTSDCRTYAIGTAGS